MSDITASPALYLKRLEVKRQDMECRINKMELRKMELDSEKTNLDENIDATMKEVAEISKQILATKEK